ETQRRTYRDHPGVRPEASVIVENAAAGTDDVLHLRLQSPPGRQLRLVDHFDHGFSAPYRTEKISKKSDVGIEPARIIADARVGRGDPDLVIRPAGEESFVDEASVGVEVDQIAIVRRAAGANEGR